MYVSEWETLAICLTRLVALGVSEDEAKADLCNTIADRKIDVRELIGGNDDFSGATFEKAAVRPPVRIASNDFDWAKSRPLKEWDCGARPLDRGPRFIALLELSTADVEDCFPGSTKRKLAAPKIKVSEAKAKAVFAQWRESHGDQIPTLDEDLKYMASKGVARERTRAIRRSFPSNPRGRKSETK